MQGVPAECLRELAERARPALEALVAASDRAAHCEAAVRVDGNAVVLEVGEHGEPAGNRHPQARPTRWIRVAYHAEVVEARGAEACLSDALKRLGVALKRRPVWTGAVRVRTVGSDRTPARAQAVMR